METDIELLERWRAGDVKAGNDLCRKHFASIYRFFASKLVRDVDELVQATFLGCVNSRDSFGSKCSFRTFLYSIACKQLYYYFRRQQRDNNALDFGVTSLVHLGTSPTGHIARGQEHERLLQALRSLPLETQLLLELFYWEEQSAAELAQIFGIPEPTARTRLFRARKALRELMDQHTDSPVAGGSIDDLDAWAQSLRDEVPR